MTKGITEDEYWAHVDEELARAAEVYTPGCKKWTDAEKAILKKYYGKVHITVLSNKLNRSTGSVRIRAQRMGLAEIRKYSGTDG